MLARRFLARLDEHEDAAVRELGSGDRLERSDRCEERVAVVDRSPSVQPVTLAHGRVRAESRTPIAERGLLIEMAVDECRLVVVTGARLDLEEEARRKPGKRHDLDRLFPQRARASPVGEESGGFHDLPVRFPIGIEVRREARDRHVLAQDLERAAFPVLVSYGSRRCRVQLGHRVVPASPQRPVRRAIVQHASPEVPETVAKRASPWATSASATFAGER